MWENIGKKIKFTSESYISMALGLLVIIVVGVLIYNFFQAKTKIEEPIGGEVITGEKTQAEEEASLPTIHKVVPGETLWSIAEKYFDSGYNWVDIAEENNVPNPNYIEKDQELKVPKAEKKLSTAPVPIAQTQSISEESYRVVRGDNLWDIAVRAYGDGFAWLKIAEANNLANPYLIHTGNVFIIPR